jgi:hypothetical protein
MTNPFYSSEQTELSRAVLGEVVGAVPEAILIGGWGTWVRTGGPMSHDVDLIARNWRCWKRWSMTSPNRIT